MPIPVTNPPWKLPAYVYHGGPLPKGGPDRMRLAIAYGEAIAEGLTHAAAVERARGQLKLLHVLVRSLGLSQTIRSIGEYAMGVSVDALGDQAYDFCSPTPAMKPQPQLSCANFAIPRRTSARRLAARL